MGRPKKNTSSNTSIDKFIKDMFKYWDIPTTSYIKSSYQKRIIVV